MKTIGITQPTVIARKKTSTFRPYIIVHQNKHASLYRIESPWYPFFTNYLSENWNGAAKMPYTKSTLDKMNTSKVITNSKHTKRKQESSVKRKSEKENSQEKRYTIEAYKQKKMWEKRLNENYFKLFRRTRSMSISRKERFRSSNTEQQGRR